MGAHAAPTPPRKRRALHPTLLGRGKSFAGERKSPDGENQACGDASHFPPAPQILSIALLSIWGASLLPIANCLSLAYPRLSERQPVGCHLSYLRSWYFHIIAHVHPLTAALVSPQPSAKRTRLPPTLRYALPHPQRFTRFPLAPRGLIIL